MKPVVTKKKKAGRPVKDIKKEVRITIRFTRAEHFIVKEKTRLAGIHTAAYIRKAALFVPIQGRLTEEERNFIRQLIGLANNINQLAKTARLEGMLKALYYFESTRKQLDGLLKKLRDGE